MVHRLKSRAPPILSLSSDKEEETLVIGFS